jgi:hypothetical protein
VKSEQSSLHSKTAAKIGTSTIVYIEFKMAKNLLMDGISFPNILEQIEL